MGLLRRLFGATNERPVITQTESLIPERINEVVGWFVANEHGVRKHISLAMSSMVLAGYGPATEPVESMQLECDTDQLKCGLRNRVTFAVYGRLCSLRQGFNSVSERSFGAHLDKVATELQELVVTMGNTDRDGSELIRILTDIKEPALTFIHSPDPLAQVSQFREAIDRRVLQDQRARHIAALFITKSVLEIEFYILCWLYFNWYGKQYNSPAFIVTN